MRENRSYGSVRGPLARAVPTATAGSREPSMISQSASKQYFVCQGGENSCCTYDKAIVHKNAAHDSRRNNQERQDSLT
jgi:hypothetical protein